MRIDYISVKYVILVRYSYMQIKKRVLEFPIG